MPEDQQLKPAIDTECRLCGDSNGEEVEGPQSRVFYKCPTCGSYFRPPGDMPDWNTERLRYVSHENHPDNPGYRTFLNRMARPLLSFLTPEMHGLDYGCGPYPVLSKMLHEHGIKAEPCDPIFFPRPLRGPYDFIVSTETFEHFHYPARELKLLTNALKPGGFLAVMTQSPPKNTPLKEWYYAIDNTHVFLYTLESFNYICKNWMLEEVFYDNNAVRIFKS